VNTYGLRREIVCCALAVLVCVAISGCGSAPAPSTEQVAAPLATPVVSPDIPATFPADSVASTDPPGSVYSYEGGSHYHKKNCRQVADRFDLAASTATEAWDSWFEPCQICKPEGYEAFVAGQKQQQRQQQQWQQQQTFQQPARQITVGTVYVTKTGSKYHGDGCQYVRSSKIPMGLEAAQGQGYTACSRCKPSG